MIYLKIPIISPGAYFWSKGLFAGFFLGGLIFGGGGLYMDEYLRFANAFFFVQTTVIFLRFSAHNLSLLSRFFTLFLIMYLQLQIPHCIANRIPTP